MNYFKALPYPPLPGLKTLQKTSPFFRKEAVFLITRSFLVGVIFQVELDEAGKEEKKEKFKNICCNQHRSKVGEGALLIKQRVYFYHFASKLKPSYRMKSTNTLSVNSKSFVAF
jgi:hypothetical protein